MLKLLLKKILYVFSLLSISYLIYNLTVDAIIKPIYGLNSVEIWFSYLDKSANFSINLYDEKLNKTSTIERYYGIESITDGSENQVIVERSDISIPFFESHKVEFVFEGKDNLVFIKKISVNGKGILLDRLVSNLKPNGQYKVGTRHGEEGIYILLNQPKVELDVTEALNLTSITTAEYEKLSSDAVFLKFVWEVLCFISTSVVFVIIRKLLLIICNKRSDIPWNTQGNFLFNNTDLITAIGNVVNSYYLLNKTKFDTFQDAQGSYGSLVILFIQNYIPLLLTIFSPMTIALFFKNKVIRILGSFVSLAFLSIVLVDNSIQNSIGTRLNFNFIGKFGGDAKYIRDFAVNYFSGISGDLMIASVIIALGLSIWVVISNKIALTKRTIKYYAAFLTISTVLGIWPYKVGEYDFLFSNVFQVNNWAFSVQGDFNKDYDANYAPRDNLEFGWRVAPGFNKKQNVIVVMVESLGCNFTYLCGSGPAYMPNVERIAKENLLYDNYYSSIPSTSLSYLSINKSVPVIQDRNNKDLSLPYRKKIYSENDMTLKFKQNNYTTRFISSTDLVFEMDKSIAYTSYDEVIDSSSPVFKNYQEKYVFNSVSDDVLFKEIVNLTKKEKSNYLYVTKTASNHSPYNSPYGALNIKKAFEFTDNAISNFIAALEANNYFENGIVVLVGDHHAWGSTMSLGQSPSDINKVPLIIVDGKHKGRIDHSVFAHSSLGVLLQYMELPEYKLNRFNFDPVNKKSTEFIFGYDYQKPSIVSLKYGERETNILLSGNDTQIMEPNLFTPEEQNDILGYLAWFR